MKLRIQKLHPNAQLPVYATDGAACFDLFAATVNGLSTLGATIYSGHPVICGTGLAFEIPEGWAMKIYSRSGHGFKHDIRLANSTGIIDSDYRGEVQIKLTSDRWDSDDDVGYFIRPGERVAQAMLIPYWRCEFDVAEQLTMTDRGDEGFGSTGL